MPGLGCRCRPGRGGPAHAGAGIHGPWKLNVYRVTGAPAVNLTAWSLYVLGKRHGFARGALEPHNLSVSLIGASLLWVGWRAAVPLLLLLLTCTDTDLTETSPAASATAQ